MIVKLIVKFFSIGKFARAFVSVASYCMDYITIFVPDYDEKAKRTKKIEISKD